MSDRERRLRELLDQRAKEFRARATMPARLLRRARTSMAVTALAVCLVASGLGYGAFAGVRALRGQAVPAVRNPTPSHQSLPPPPTSLSTPSPSPISVPGTQLVLPLSGPVDQLSVGDGALYAAYSPTGDLDHEVIVRLDLRTHAVVHSAPLLAGIAMAVADGVGPQVVWVTHWDESNPGSRILSGLDSRTLADVIPGVGVPGIPEVGGPGSPSELVATPAGLWVGTGTRLDLLEWADMRLVSASTLDGTVGAMGTDPTGRLLYVSTSDPAGAGPRSIYEFDAASGALLRRTTGPVGVAVAGVSAMADGVWVAVATGLLGAVDFYRASDLKHTATYEVKRGGPATNGIDASVVNGTLWVTDGMIGAVACTDPATGRVREVIISGFNSGYGFSNVVGVGSNVYVGIDGGVLAITPSARCLG